MTSDDARQAEIAEFLQFYPPGIATLARRLRTLVGDALPGAIERLRPGWHLIGYDLPTKGKGHGEGTYLAWVFPESEHVHIGWPTGTLMDDPDHLLHGAEEKLKKARYLTFLPEDRIPSKVVKDFTRDAARIATIARGERQLLASLRDQPNGDG